MQVTPRDAEAESTPALTVGVEEEFLLVDPETGRLVPRNVATADAAHAAGDRVDLELLSVQVETQTGVCTDLAALRADVAGQRATAAAAARAAGARLVALGAPVADPIDQPLTNKPRYHRMADQYGLLVDESGLCGCHVHVGVPDRETGVQVSNHLRPWLPALLALTANSSIHRGRDTGYASWRSVLFGRWPSAGPPPHFRSAEHYDAVVAMLLDSGVIFDEAMIYWDVRLSHHLPTIEVRVSDVPATVDETVLVATLIRALVGTALRLVGLGRAAPALPPEQLPAAYWLAAHDGVDGRALDLAAGRPTTAAALLTGLVERVRPDLEEFGAVEFTQQSLARVLADGNGAALQRRVLAETGRSAAVVEAAARRTLEGVTAPLGDGRDLAP